MPSMAPSFWGICSGEAVGAAAAASGAWWATGDMGRGGMFRSPMSGSPASESVLAILAAGAPAASAADGDAAATDPAAAAPSATPASASASGWARLVPPVPASPFLSLLPPFSAAALASAASAAARDAATSALASALKGASAPGSRRACSPSVAAARAALRASISLAWASWDSLSFSDSFCRSAMSLLRSSMESCLFWLDWSSICFMVFRSSMMELWA
mmetsp:Transcript_18185/g.43017  ORF Transcript_18185/g.43017 Transcript_18185/m.43017 type:complete len:218 (+) Transcript_18185:172-825(+)